MKTIVDSKGTISGAFLAAAHNDNDETRAAAMAVVSATHGKGIALLTTARIGTALVWSAVAVTKSVEAADDTTGETGRLNRTHYKSLSRLVVVHKVTDASPGSTLYKYAATGLRAGKDASVLHQYVGKAAEDFDLATFERMVDSVVTARAAAERSKRNRSTTDATTDATTDTTDTTDATATDAATDAAAATDAFKRAVAAALDAGLSRALLVELVGAV